MNPLNRLFLMLLLFLSLPINSQPVTETPSVLSHRDRVAVVNTVLQERLDNLLPQLMQESGLDMWLVIHREYSEDALFYSLVPQPTFAARRTTILVFYKNPKTKLVERFSVSRYPIGSFYPTRWTGGSLEQQWQRLAEIIRQLKPTQIGINVSKDWALADGLTAGLHKQLVKYLDKADVQNIVSAESLVIRWLETRIPSEIKSYPHIVAIARSVISEAFSNKVITPGVTTTDDVAWYIRHRFEDLNVRPWFQPYVNVQRQGDNNPEQSNYMGKGKRTILRGDILHTDVGLCYLTLCTDTQEMGYVLKTNEQDVPAGLKKALSDGNRWQDTLTQQFKTGLTGNEILVNAKVAAEKNQLKAAIYTHPIGFVGHAVGPTIGMWDNQKHIPIKGDWKLYQNTAYAIEGNIKTQIKEWDNEWIQIKLEQTALFDGQSVHYVAGRQETWHLVK